MNRFATIVELYRFREVTFYSIKIEDEPKPLGLQFLDNNSRHPHFQVLIEWIKRIGNDYAAAKHYFRSEKTANALPPPINITHRESILRWYCLRMNHTTVIVFNGGIKTKQKAQDCPNVAPHFYQAIHLSNKLWKAFDREEIWFDDEDTLIIEEGFLLYIK